MHVDFKVTVTHEDVGVDEQQADTVWTWATDTSRTLGDVYGRVAKAIKFLISRL